MKAGALTHTGISKVARYKWELQDAPGVLLEIDKNELKIDESYQRKSKEEKILAMARSWSWIGCGVLIVAEREGCFFVMDGQHRLLAARQRSDITALPCIVFATVIAEQEARGFLVSNTLRRPISGIDRFRASIVAGTRSAQIVQELLIQAHRVASEVSDGRSVRCLSKLVKLAETDETTLRAMWPIAVEICAGKVFHERIIDALVYIEQRLPSGESLTQPKWRQRLIAAGHHGLHDAMNRSCMYHGQSALKVLALGVLNSINKGVRHKLQLAGTE